ncbi:ABC transporter permease subunit [Opitutia bacterium ISCC 51]|nr:ABC transporter permease subunit [Opitutae bacterium ISCC 51]QXD28759.1 ABC transporter permease subunit [Opitutae bacterium ISCC 52]
MNKSVFTSWIYPMISGGVILLIWILIGTMLGSTDGGKLSEEQADSIRRVVLPYPNEIWQAAVEERTHLAAATFNTFKAAIIGFLSAIGIGLSLALILSSSLALKKSLYPWILVLQMTPIIILAPIIAIWLKQGAHSVTIIAFLISFFPIVANTTLGLTSTDKNLLELFAVSKASKLQEILHLRLPYALPHFLTGAKIAATLAPIGAIAGDIFVGTTAGGQGGLGFLAILYKGDVNTPALYACAAIACLMGFLFVGLIHYVQWALLHSWHESTLESDT